MTTWLREQMVTNAQSDVVGAIRQNMSSYVPWKQDAALQAWAALVGTGAIWDFKPDILKARQFVAGTHDITFGTHQLSYDAIANMHYGFVGRAAGINGRFLVGAAGLAQLKRFVFETQDLDDLGSPFCYFDHRFATWSIKFGIFLYEKFKDDLSGLTDEAFLAALDEYIDKNGEPPPPPKNATH